MNTEGRLPGRGTALRVLRVPPSAAGEALAECGEGLVVREAAARGVLAREGVRGRGSGLVGLLLGDLGLVGLPARLRRRVLLLPLVALLLEALAPLVGLRVEAVGVLVVPLLVVLGDHAVERRVELRALGVDALVRLLERQRDAAPLEVDVDDLDEDVLTD